jgi:serine/threonine protein kinase
MAKNEIATLKRYQVEGQKDRERLIRLLVSFEYNRKFYLVFPWADANLEEFWTAKFPNIGDLPRGCVLGRWLAGEMLGLARGLRLIHNPPHSDSSKPCPLGRHGDIKPANILWFSRERDPELTGGGRATDEAGLPTDEAGLPTGMLKICDFGLVEFHSKDSVSRVRPSRIEGQTDTYSPPEGAPNSKRFISQRYDSWSLGCVLLQFVTWYAQGGDGVETFDNMRKTFEREYKNGNRYSDLFYSRSRGKACVKPAVTKVGYPSVSRN